MTAPTLVPDAPQTETVASTKVSHPTPGRRRGDRVDLIIATQQAIRDYYADPQSPKANVFDLAHAVADRLIADEFVSVEAKA